MAIINVNAQIDRTLEVTRRNAWDVFEKHQGADRADIERRLKDLDRRLNRFEGAALRDDFERHDLMRKYYLAAEDCERKDTISSGGFAHLLQKREGLIASLKKIF